MANFQPMAAVKMLGGSPVPLLRGIEAAGQSYLRGALLVNSAGSLAVAAADPAVETLVGIAANAATGTTGAEVLFAPLVPDLVIEATIDIAAGTLALTQAMLYSPFGIGVDAGRFFIDQADTAAANVRVIPIELRDAVGTVSARIYALFFPAASIWGNNGV